jgi:type IV pilus assembly protein PilQ
MNAKRTIKTLAKKAGWMAVTALLAVCLLSSCATNKAAKDPSASSTPSHQKLITDIRTEDDASSVAVRISADQELTFSSVKQPSPLAVILYLPQTSFAETLQSYSPENHPLIDRIVTSQLMENGQTGRIKILLKKDAPYEINSDDSELSVLFKVPVQPKAEVVSDGQGASPPAKVPAATQIMDVEALKAVSGIQVDVMADGSISDYKSFTIDDPARIVFDIFNVKSATKKEQVVQVNSKWIKRIRHYGYPDRVRLVVDTHKAYLNGFVAQSMDNGLRIQVGAPNMISSGTGAGRQMKKLPTASAASQGVASAKNPAVVNRIEFSSQESGKSTLVVGTTKPIEYNLVKQGQHALQLNLYQTQLPEYHKRPLITTRFESAVDRILPSPAAGDVNAAVVLIQMRENVPYFVEQTDSLLQVHFEPSSVAPKPYAQTPPPEWKKTLLAPASGGSSAVQPSALLKPETTDYAAPSPAMSMDAAPAAGNAPESQLGAKRLYTTGSKRYTGEKIALDFYETDIKNVFRILREVSGKNFAIDKNVTGKVTMTLDTPVPWDQVLDLVLRMNQLGMVQEGDIIRIATLESIKKEEELIRAKIAAKQKTEEQIKSLEPLATEYIPINYAQAKDIVPHLNEIKTDGRGSISVDDRTNTIIMTDVTDALEQAKAIAVQLDKPTAQVIIESRIVEAEANFARELGIKWAVGYGPKDSNTLGGLWGLDGAVNLPATVKSGVLGFNFARIAGTPLVINAELSANEATGNLRIISSPKILTLDNQEAVIKQGVEVPYFEESESGGTTVQFKKVDLVLTVTPHVTNDNRISMQVEIIKNDVGTSLPGEQPPILTKEAKTELLVNDGETVVIGGINKSTQSEGEQRIPVLADIPGLNWLFKTREVEDRKEELLIFITPRILRLQSV